MSTPYSKVFASFLGKIESDIYQNMVQADAESDMILLLNAAILNFEYPKVDLMDKNDVAMIFANDLGLFEIEILGFLMVVAWIDRKVNNIRLINQRLSDKDFRLTSQAAHLESLLKLKQDKQTDINNLKTKYSYRDSQTPNKPNFSGLSGDV